MAAARPSGGAQGPMNERCGTKPRSADFAAREPHVTVAETNPQPLFDIAFAFRQAKVLLSAVELGLFTVLAEAPQDCDALVRRLVLNGRGARDFFDALVAMRLLQRDDEGRYSN